MKCVKIPLLFYCTLSPTLLCQHALSYAFPQQITECLPCVPGTMLGAKSEAVNKTDKNSAFTKPIVLGRLTTNKINYIKKHSI